MDKCIGNLNQKRFNVGDCTRNTSGFHLAAALVIPWTATSPRAKVVGSWKYGHVATNLRKDSDWRHRITAQTGNSAKKRKDICKRLAEAQNLLLQSLTMLLKLVDVVETLAQLDSLFGRNSTINGSLNLGKRSFAASVHELNNIEMLTGMSKNVFGDGTSGFAEDIGEYIIQFQIRNGEAVQRTVLLAGQHIRQLHAVTNKVA